MDWKKYYDEGLNDAEISRILGCCTETVRIKRKKENLPSNFSYKSFRTIDYGLVKKLVLENKSDSEIAEILNASKDGIYSIRKKLKIKRKALNIAGNIELTDLNYQYLVGSLMGDGSLIKNHCFPSFKTEHKVSQKQYSEMQKKLIHNLNPSLKYRKRKTPDKRTGKYYESYVLTTRCNQALLLIHEQFYKNKIKIIPIDFLNKYYTSLSLAIHFMDDGFKTDYGYCLSTDCFTIDDLENFAKLLFNKFKLKTSIHKKHKLYIKSCSRNNFTNLVSPFIVDSMKYKLHVT